MITFHAEITAIDREHVNKNWFRMFMTYLNVKIDQ